MGDPFLDHQILSSRNSLAHDDTPTIIHFQCYGKASAAPVLSTMLEDLE